MGGVAKIFKKVTSIFTGGEEAPEKPFIPGEKDVEDPKTAPDPDDKTLAKKNERDLVARRSSGRAETILSDNNKLG